MTALQRRILRTVSVFNIVLGITATVAGLIPLAVLNVGLGIGIFKALAKDKLQREGATS